jgi:uncharacterized membrane protein YjgN (DUF898 family)
METAVSELSPNKQLFNFSGSGREYFRIWIVNLALTILTLGIYSAWAKVRRLKYFYGHTQLDGHHFDYLADPKKILIGRVIAVLLLILYSQGTTFFPSLALYIVGFLLLLLPFIIVSSSAFSFRNTAYRNVRFHFRKDIAAAYRRVMPPLAIVLVLMGIMYVLLPEQISTQEGDLPRGLFVSQLVVLVLLPFIPWLDHIRSKFVIGHLQYGKAQGSFRAGVWDFYKLYLVTLLAFVALAVIVSLAVGVFVRMQAPTEEAEPSFTVIIAALLLLYALLFIVMSFFIASRNNLLRNHTQIGNNRLYGDFAAGAMLWLLFSNAVAIVCTLGMFTPWAGIRLARYNAAHTRMDTANLDDTVAEASSDESAIGEEIGEFFDIDIGI